MSGPEPCPECDGGRAYTLHPDNLGNIVRDYSCLECGSTGEVVDWDAVRQREDLT